ncbi:MAG: hypothetical protein AAGU27_11260 [Dehalobacterium sp.]
MRIYLCASWKNRRLVRHLAQTLRLYNHEVFDFTDQNCRKTCETPPEMFPERFDPSKHIYREYINRDEWRDAVNENREAIKWSDLIILLLPCGIDATADWALGIGMGKCSIIVGHPNKGERSEVHLWADAILNDISEIIPWINNNLNRLQT